jgi:hypothetical protein
VRTRPQAVGFAMNVINLNYCVSRKEGEVGYYAFITL